MGNKKQDPRKKNKPKNPSELAKSKFQTAVRKNRSARMPKAGKKLRACLFAYSVWGILTTSNIVVNWLNSGERNFFKSLALVFVEISVSMQLQAFVIALMILAAILLRYRREWTMIAIYSTLITTTSTVIAPNFFGGTSADPSERAFSVATLSLNQNNRRPEQALGILMSRDFDVVFFQELNSRAAQLIKASVYPYVHISRNGTAVLSFFPIQEVEEYQYFTKLEILIGGSKVTVLNTDAPSMLGTDKIHNRNDLLKEIAEISVNTEGAFFAVGNLCLTPWSYFFRKLEREGNLYDSKVGFGLLATWPAQIGLFRVPIDHILVSDGLVPTAMGKIQTPGTDHLALHGTFAFAEVKES